MGIKMVHEEFVIKVVALNEYVKNGQIKILGKYVNSDTPIKCECLVHDCVWNPKPGHLYHGGGCKKCGIEQRIKKRTFLHEEFVKQLRNCNNNITVIDQYINMLTPIRFQCLKGHIWSTTPSSIIQGEGCPYCTNRKILIGYNDLWTTHPHIAQLLTDPNDGYKYTYGSNKKVNFTCPYCGTVQKKVIKHVHQDGFGCTMCSDGISYPNKFIRCVLKQLNVCFTPEYAPDWGLCKKYDCYFKHNGVHYLVEMDGIQHYEESSLIKESLEEVQRNDELKTKLAIENGFTIIRIDCRVSRCDYIQNNIVCSQLNDIFDLSNINWDLCNATSQKSLINEACSLYMSGVRNLKDISNLLYIHEDTVRGYLKIGAKLDWCDFDPVKSRQEFYQRITKPIYVIDKLGNTMCQFNNTKECALYMEKVYDTIFLINSIQSACRTGRTYRGFYFKYV